MTPRRSPQPRKTGLLLLLAAMFGATAGAGALAFFCVEKSLRLTAGESAALVAADVIGGGAVLALLGLAVWSARRLQREWVIVRNRDQWLATTLRSIGDGMIVGDTAGRVTLVNETAQTITGWSEEEARGRPVAEIFQPLRRETREPVESAFDRALRDGKKTAAPDPRLVVGRNGLEHLVTGSAAPLRDATGALVGATLIFHDVTQAELGEAALRASQEMFRIISDHVSDLIAVLDLQGRRLYASRSYSRHFPAKDFYLSSAFDDVHPDDLARIRGQFAEMLSTRRTQRAEFRLVRPDGGTIFLESESSVITDAKGQPDKILVVSRDITERHASEERVSRELQFTETLINSMPGIFYLYDARRKILRWNKTLETVTGCTAEEIRTLDPLSYFPEEERPLVHERMLQCFTAGASDIEVHLLAKDGRKKPYYVTGLRLDVDGHPCMLGIGIDISARLAAEEALRHAHASLEIKVADRTRDLAAANERLQELDRLKSEFLATMSHELRTPLNSVIGFTGILRQGLAGPVNDEQKKQLGMVDFSARHLLGLINDLLDLSRLESGKMEIVREDFKIAEVAAEVVQSLAPIAAQKNLRLETSLDDPALVLRSDRKKCFQILLNLANNAVKFTDTGTVTLAIRATAAQVEMSVTDTGIGIKPESLAQLFEAFRQVDGSARRTYEGTGLGLYLCKQLATMLGGSIAAESEFGKGSRFTVTLPRTTPETTT